MNPSNPDAGSDIESRVLHELEELRTRRGLSTDKLREATTILSLPATQDELIYGAKKSSSQNLSQETRLLHAAEKMLHCAVKRIRPLRRDYRDVMFHTLNLEGTSSDLNQRQRKLRESIPETESAYKVLEKRAYGDFAAKLASLDKSPCRDDYSDGPPTSADVWQALDAFRYVDDPRLQAALFPALFQYIPRGSAAVGYDPNDSRIENVQRVSRLVRGTLENAWPPSGMRESRVDFLLGRTALYNVFRMALVFQETPDVAERTVMVSERIDRMHAARDDNAASELADVDGNPTSEFYVRLAAGVRELANAILVVEAEDSWATVLRGGGTLATVR